MFHNKSSVCNFSTCVIFGPLIIFHHDVTKTQILSKVSFCIFYDANNYKNNQNDQKQVFHLITNLWISDGHFPMSWCNENTDIEHGLIFLWHDQQMAVRTLETSDSRIWGNISVIIFNL